MERIVRLWAIGLVFFWMPIAGVVGAQPANEGSGQEQVVTGTLIRLDLTAMKGLVKTDLGKPIFFEVTKPHLFENLSVGDRVTMQIDGHGRAEKVIDASVADFVQPAELTPDELGSLPAGRLSPVVMPLIGMTR